MHYTYMLLCLSFLVPCAATYTVGDWYILGLGVYLYNIIDLGGPENPWDALYSQFFAVVAALFTHACHFSPCHYYFLMGRYTFSLFAKLRP